LGFLDAIQDKFVEEWLAIEGVAQKGFDLRYSALGYDAGSPKHSRFDPPYSILRNRSGLKVTLLLPNDAPASQPIKWKSCQNESSTG